MAYEKVIKTRLKNDNCVSQNVTFWIWTKSSSVVNRGGTRSSRHHRSFAFVWHVLSEAVAVGPSTSREDRTPTRRGMSDHARFNSWRSKAPETTDQLPEYRIRKQQTNTVQNQQKIKFSPLLPTASNNHRLRLEQLCFFLFPVEYVFAIEQI